MVDLAECFPFSLFHTTPSFQDFIIAAQRVQPTDALILKNGSFEKKCAYEEGEEKLNQRTWRAFRHAVEQEFSETQRDHLCARYRFDWDRIAYSSLPLERRYIEYFGVGAANPYTYTLQEHLPWYSSLQKQSPKEIHNLFERASRMRFIGNMEDPSKVHGGAVDVHEGFTNDRYLGDKHRANLFRGVGDLVSKDPSIPRMHPYYSRLSMGIICLLETEKKYKDIELVIPAPGAKEGETEYYKIHEIISEGGLTAVALVPVSEKSSLAPLLCFRCTKQSLGQNDAVLSVLNDIEEHIGESGYKAAQKKLAELMEDPAFTRGKKINVLCYSLGGGHAGYFMRDFWPRVEQFIGFNFVGSDARVVESLANEINSLGENEIPPSFYIHRNVSNRAGTAGDWVNKSGQKHIGWGIKHPNARVQVTEWIINERDYPAPTEDIYDPVQFGRWMDLHGARPMDSELEGKVKGKFHALWRYKYNLYQGGANCDRVLDTYNRDRTLEDLRRKVGHEIVYKFVSWAYSILDFAYRLFGLEFFKRNL